jgi:hypothetical protein
VQQQLVAKQWQHQLNVRIGVGIFVIGAGDDHQLPAQ